MLVSIAFRPTDLPVPVDPAMSRCGIVARSITYGSPWIVFPSASVSFDDERSYASDCSSSRREIASRFGLGIWIPTVDLPGMRSISTDSASIARQRSSARLVILLYFTPASGLNSNVVTTGPGWICATWPSTANSRHFSSSWRAESINSRSSIFCSALAGSSSDRGGSVNAPCRRGVFDGSRSGNGSCGAMVAAALFFATTAAAAGSSAASFAFGASLPAGPAAAAFFVCFAITSSRCFCLRRASGHPPPKPAPPGDQAPEALLGGADNPPNDEEVEEETRQHLQRGSDEMRPRA